MENARIKNGTVVRFKRSGQHEYEYAIIVPKKDDPWGRSELKSFDFEKKRVGFGGYSRSFLMNCEIVCSLNYRKLTYAKTLIDSINANYTPW